MVHKKPGLQAFVHVLLYFSKNAKRDSRQAKSRDGVLLSVVIKFR